MKETLIDDTSSPKRKSGILITFGFILIAVYAISSVLAMHDLWKFNVDQRFSFSFGDPMRHYNSGMLYIYISIAALLGSSILFFMTIRRRNSTNVRLYGIIAGLLSILGIASLFSSPSIEPSFGEYITAHFSPFWLLTLAAFFMICGISALLNLRKQ